MSKREKEVLIKEYKIAIKVLNKLDLIDSSEVLRQEIKKLEEDIYLEDYEKEEGEIYER